MSFDELVSAHPEDDCIPKFKQRYSHLAGERTTFASTRKMGFYFSINATLPPTQVLSLL